MISSNFLFDNHLFAELYGFKYSFQNTNHFQTDVFKPNLYYHSKSERNRLEVSPLDSVQWHIQDTPFWDAFDVIATLGLGLVDFLSQEKSQQN